MKIDDPMLLLLPPHRPAEFIKTAGDVAQTMVRLAMSDAAIAAQNHRDGGDEDPVEA